MGHKTIPIAITTGYIKNFLWSLVLVPSAECSHPSQFRFQPISIKAPAKLDHLQHGANKPQLLELDVNFTVKINYVRNISIDTNNTIILTLSNTKLYLVSSSSHIWRSYYFFLCFNNIHHQLLPLLQCMAKWNSKGGKEEDEF